jgi:hypothetical protein
MYFRQKNISRLLQKNISSPMDGDSGVFSINFSESKCVA